MSGGVDSSVAAHLLRTEGHDIVGLFMRHGQAAPGACATGASPAALPIVTPAAHKQGCCSASDADDARHVADRLDIPFYALNFEQEFGRIIDYFVDEYTSGRTPNPCVMCNNWLKFGKLFDYADQIGADLVATGHYAQIGRGAAGETTLLRGMDASKDQSYVLFGIERRNLDRVLFPIGGYQKADIRAMAKDLGLRVADKKDSQEICFVPDGDYAKFVETRLGDDFESAGELVTVEGDVVGHHAGVQHYTIGQRKGLGVAFGEPRYVVRLEPVERRVVIGTREQLARNEFTASAVNWLIDEPPAAFECDVKIRYLSKPTAATITPLSERRMRVALHEPRDGVAPGQAAVCYDGDRVLGGGWIE